MEYAIGIFLGIALAASCGFRTFVPLLVANIASHIGLAHFSDGFAWMGTWISFAIFLTATLAEAGTYYVPWLDHALDLISKPLAIVAGSLLAASFFGDIDPTLKWVLGIVAGGGTAGIVAAGTVAARAVSTSTTAGAGNFIVTSSENAASVVFSGLSFIIPVIMGILTIFLVVFSLIAISKWASKKRTRSKTPLIQKK